MFSPVWIIWSSCHEILMVAHPVVIFLLCTRTLRGTIPTLPLHMMRNRLLGTDSRWSLKNYIRSKHWNVPHLPWSSYYVILPFFPFLPAVQHPSQHWIGTTSPRSLPVIMGIWMMILVRMWTPINSPLLHIWDAGNPWIKVDKWHAIRESWMTGVYLDNKIWLFWYIFYLGAVNLD